MTDRSALSTVLVVVLVLAAGCSSSVGSDAALPGAGPTIASTITPTTTELRPTPATDVAVTDSTASVGTETPPTSTDPAVTSPPVPVTDAPAPVLSAPTAATTVVYAGTGFGGGWPALATWNGSAWQAADFDDEGDELIAPASDFAAVSVASLGLDAPISGLAYGAQDFVCVDDRMGPTIDLPVAVGEIAASGGYDAVAVATDWDVQPRPVQQVGLDVVEYQMIGESITAAAGVDGTGGDVVQAVRADLDGDGVEEVFVTFEKITPDGFGTPGDFSVVFVRYPTAAGDVVDDVLFEYYPGPPTDFPSLGAAGLLAIADLNGDAVMEVVLRSTFWESSIVELYSFASGTLEPVADAGCGL